MTQNSTDFHPIPWQPDRASLRRPVYSSLAERLEQDIANGVLPPGTKLPPQRELADFLGVNFTTVTRAYKLCEFKGLIYGVTGCGTFVAPNAARSITITSDNTPGTCIDLGFVASFEQSNGLVAETVKKVLRKKYLPRLLTYDDPTGMPHHKAAGITWLERFGIRAEPETLVIASGAQNANAMALIALFSPGQRIATDQYTYSNLIMLARMLHIHLVPVKGDEEGMLPGELHAQCRQMDIHGVFLMPSCANPTTVMISDRRKHALAEVIRRHELILVEDDISAFLVAGVMEDYVQPMAALLPERTVYISGTTKCICSGLRVAYMVCPEAFHRRITQAVFNVNVKTSSLDAEIITELILSGQAATIVEQKQKLALAANDVFEKYFPQPENVGRPLSFYRWLPIGPLEAGPQIEADLERKGVRVYHSSRFLAGQGGVGQYLRIALSSARTLGELEKGLAMVKAHLQ